MNMRIFKVHQSEEGQTLEKYIQKLLMSAPSSFIYKIFRKKDVKVNGHHEDRKFKLSENFSNFLLEPHKMGFTIFSMEQSNKIYYITIFFSKLKLIFNSLKNE